MPARTEAPRCARGGCSGRSRRHRNAPRAGRCREWVDGRRRRVRALCCSFRFCFGVAARLHGRPLPHMTTRRHQSVCAWRWCTCLASLGSAGAERKTGAVGGGGEEITRSVQPTLAGRCVRGGRTWRGGGGVGGKPTGGGGRDAGGRPAGGRGGATGTNNSAGRGGCTRCLRGGHWTAKNGGGGGGGTHETHAAGNLDLLPRPEAAAPNLCCGLWW